MRQDWKRKELFEIELKENFFIDVAAIEGRGLICSRCDFLMFWHVFRKIQVFEDEKMFVDVLLEKNVRGRQTACRQMLIRCERESFGQLKMILRLFLFLFGSSATRDIWRTVKL